MSSRNGTQVQGSERLNPNNRADTQLAIPTQTTRQVVHLGGLAVLKVRQNSLVRYPSSIPSWFWATIFDEAFTCALQRRAGMAGYAEIAAHYRTLIERGELSPGDRLPPLREVMQQFAVAQKTAARAYAQLKSEGLTEATTGGGTVVATRLPTARSGAIRSDRVAAGLNPLLRDEAVVGRMAGWRSVDDPVAAEALGLELRDEVVVRTRVFTRTGTPSIYAVSVYHPRAATVLPELAVQGPGLTDWEAQYQERTGRTVYRSPDRYGARIATPHELDSLMIHRRPWETCAVLTVTVIWHDDQGPLAYWEDIYAPGLSATP